MPSCVSNTKEDAEKVKEAGASGTIRRPAFSPPRSRLPIVFTWTVNFQPFDKLRAGLAKNARIGYPRGIGARKDR
jgi:hypothetical protein